MPIVICGDFNSMPRSSVSKVFEMDNYDICPEGNEKYNPNSIFQIP